MFLLAGVPVDQLSDGVRAETVDRTLSEPAGQRRPLPPVRLPSAARVRTPWTGVSAAADANRAWYDQARETERETERLMGEWSAACMTLR
jgi:hypothetical protein